MLRFGVRGGEVGRAGDNETQLFPNPAHFSKMPLSGGLEGAGGFCPPPRLHSWKAGGVGGAHLGNAFGMPLCTLSIREAQTEFPLPRGAFASQTPHTFPITSHPDFPCRSLFFFFFSHLPPCSQAQPPAPGGLNTPLAPFPITQPGGPQPGEAAGCSCGKPEDEFGILRP